MNPDKPTVIPRGRVRAYTLIEALVASSVLIIGISAAASLSLAFITQEEITERSVKAINYLDNATALLQAGVPASDITAILPPEPVVTSLTFTDRTLTATHLGAVPSTLLTLTWKPNAATESAGIDRWTGGKQDVTRTSSIEVIHTRHTLAGPLPRVDFFD